MEESPHLVSGKETQRPGAVYRILNTPLLATTYKNLLDYLESNCTSAPPLAIDFTNTHIVTMRRHEPQFVDITSRFDYFVPDGMPLIWVMNILGANLKDRVYGPTFMRHAIEHSSPTIRHFFLGGSQECLNRLTAQAQAFNPSINIVGTQNGYFSKEESAKVFQAIIDSKADFIWVGLGTPKQQSWIHENKQQFSSGVLLAVGFAFDVNAGTKSDAPPFLQKRGLTWLYRIIKEPKRLFGRYLKYNSLFIAYLILGLLGIKPRLTHQS